jgi:branched-chain amino acid transport system permease protein
VARRYAAPEVQWILYGLFMILIVFILPQGIVPAIEKWLSTRKDRDRAGIAEANAQDAP